MLGDVEGQRCFAHRWAGGDDRQRPGLEAGGLGVEVDKAAPHPRGLVGVFVQPFETVPGLAEGIAETNRLVGSTLVREPHNLAAGGVEGLIDIEPGVAAEAFYHPPRRQQPSAELQPVARPEPGQRNTTTRGVRGGKTCLPPIATPGLPSRQVLLLPRPSRQAAQSAFYV